MTAPFVMQTSSACHRTTWQAVGWDLPHRSSARGRCAHGHSDTRPAGPGVGARVEAARGHAQHPRNPYAVGEKTLATQHRMRQSVHVLLVAG